MPDRPLPAPPALPDLVPYAPGNTGVPYVWRFDSGLPGPTVGICALIHGNEICGAIALDRLIRAEVRPRRGSLTLIFANIAAARREDAAPTRYRDEDMNRVWDRATLEGPRHSSELDHARRLCPIITSLDLLLDLHSMQNHSPPLVLVGRHPKGVALADSLGLPAALVQDEGHLAGRRLRDFGEFDDPASPRTALLLECGQHQAQDSAALAFLACLRLLRQQEMIHEADLPVPLPPARPAPLIGVTATVTAQHDNFRFLHPFQGMEEIADAGTIIAYDDDMPVTTPHDACILIMPAHILRPGLTAVRLGRRLR